MLEDRLSDLGVR